MIEPVVVEAWPETRPAAVLFSALPSEPGRFLLESQGGPPDITRWSFMGHRPFLRFESYGQLVRIWEGREWREMRHDPLQALQAVLARWPAVRAAGMPPFCGGAVGYLSYDLGRQIERLPATAADDLALPGISLAFYDHVLALDGHTQTASVLAVPVPGRESSAFSSAHNLRALVAQVSAHTPSASPPGQRPTARLVSNFTRDRYLAAVERALDYIARGHIYQANIAQRFTAPLANSPESLYAALRQINPAPFAAFLDNGPHQVISASPERFLRFHPATRHVETRPIKGTRPRSAHLERDAALRAELLASEKDRAELVMIVDLERNDLGRVCDYGSVRVTDLRRIEPYPTVWHTVATVEGRLRATASLADLIHATFPGGSITGAPKIRAMQIIEELEGLRRHVYCGAIGYFGYDGEVDLNIAIRTIVVKDCVAYFHAGGGIVADSTPEGEYEETLHKAAALARALQAALPELHA